MDLRGHLDLLLPATLHRVAGAEHDWARQIEQFAMSPVTRTTSTGVRRSAR